MPKTYEITADDVQIIRRQMKETTDKKIYKRLEVVALRGEGKSNREIADITKFHAKYVSQLVSQYVNKGLIKLSTDGRKGGNHKNLSDEQELAILNSFNEEARAGKVITPGAIRKKYEEVLGREIKPTFIYAVLKRHHWRMVMPRGKHPQKASDEAIEASKKLTKFTKKTVNNIVQHISGYD